MAIGISCWTGASPAERLNSALQTRILSRDFPPLDPGLVLVGGWGVGQRVTRFRLFFLGGARGKSSPPPLTDFAGFHSARPAVVEPGETPPRTPQFNHALDTSPA